MFFTKIGYNMSGDAMKDEFNLDEIEVEKELCILFMGTPEFSVPILEGLIENYKIRAVVTQPDRKVGRD